jgi:hypothetical protein
MGKLLSLDGAVPKKQMRKDTDDTSLRIAHFGDEVRMLEIKIQAIGYFLAPRYRPEFQHALNYIQNEMPMDEATIRCVSICLDVLRERYSA